MNASYAPTVTMHGPAIQPARPARAVTRHANRLLSPNLDPNNGRHARWCPCLPGYVCADHRLTR
jgi:hypothetical protein